MTTLVIYDETGKVIMTQSGDVDFPSRVETAIVEVPNGKVVSHVNAETGEVILADVPKSDEERRIEALEAQMATLLGED